MLLITNRLPVSPDDPASPFVLDFIASLRKAGLAVSVFTPHIGEMAGNSDFPVHRFEWGESERTPSELPLLKVSSWKKIRNYFVVGKRALLEHLQRHQYDHLLALWALPSGWLAQQASEATGIPYSVWALGSDINVWAKRPISGRMIRVALRGATALFADGDELAEKVSTISGRECHFLPSFRRFQFKMMMTPREKFFLYVGRLEKSKGIFDLLKAFSRIKKDIWDYRLLIIGSGSQFDAVLKNVVSLRLRGKVHVLGRVSTDEVINYLQRAKALVIPTHSDSIPLVFGEALQTNTPMVVTNVGDLGTLVRDNKLGFAVQKKRVGALADAMVRMMVSDIDIAAQAQNLLERLSPDNAVATFLSKASGDAD